VPTIRRFAACKIAIYADDHLPLHFHIEGRGFRAVAHRVADLRAEQARLFAGCGIVADSDPDAEVAEWQAKLLPMREALGS